MQIRNIAIIAHVDHGKTTLVSAKKPANPTVPNRTNWRSTTNWAGVKARDRMASMVRGSYLPRAGKGSEA